MWDRVVVHFQGKLITGRTFDNTNFRRAAVVCYLQSRVGTPFYSTLILWWTIHCFTRPKNIRSKNCVSFFGLCWGSACERSGCSHVQANRWYVAFHVHLLAIKKLRLAVYFAVQGCLLQPRFALYKCSVFAGLQEGIQLMSPGSTFDFCIPPHLAFREITVECVWCAWNLANTLLLWWDLSGDQEINTVPPNSILLYRVQLVMTTIVVFTWTCL